MWISSIELNNVRGFVSSGEITFSKKINLLVGPNNSGKSTIIKGILNLQHPSLFKSSDKRENGKNSTVRLGYKMPDERYIPKERYWHPYIHYHINDSKVQLYMNQQGTVGDMEIHTFPSQEPNNFIYPFLSSRKTVGLIEDVRKQNTDSVNTNFQSLNSKVDRMSNPQFPKHEEYLTACKDILGFPVTSFASTNGKQSGIIVDTFKNISLESMGDGVMHLVAFIENLCIAKGKLFLIEELENDIHPKALKKLLQLIIKKSEDNQFIISTHSNIVTKYLGSESDSKIFNVSMELEDGRLPISQIKEINNTKEERIKILADLGYELWDYEVWKGWLILEESSAERIIRDFLVPWFQPSLIGKLRTVSANGLSKVELSFEDFRRLFSFIHLEEAYRNKAWVITDGGAESEAIVKKLREKFTTWSPDNFSTFTKTDFEQYYPERFSDKVKQVLSIKDKQHKRDAKKVLLAEVIDWAKANDEIAKKEFKLSAKEVIEKIKDISSKVA